ncbi:MAG: hypothetical protein ACI9R3_001169 [Verrucomicrobiales bacterium]|jgi:hypothetical protein
MVFPLFWVRWAAVTVALSVATMLGACNRSVSEKDVVVSRRAFEQDPNGHRLRQLLNLRVDGYVSYLHIALVGNAFSSHPEVFEGISKDMQTDSERRILKTLAINGADIFEYYPEHQPESFE